MSEAEQILRDALEIARQKFERIRLILVNQLEEPERTAFWTAVEARDSIRATLNPTPANGEG